MCGIVGYTGHLQAAPILLDGLSKLEYRGYDSAGLAVRNGEKDIERGCGRFLGPELSNSKTASILHRTQTP